MTTKGKNYSVASLNPNEHVQQIGHTGWIDDAKEIKMRVVAVKFETDRVVYTMGWFHAGASYEASFDAWRVTME